MRIRLDNRRLKALIRESRISQNHWALRLGVSRGHLSDLVNGRHPYPSRRTRERLLATFKVPFEILFIRETAVSGDESTDDGEAASRALAAIAFQSLASRGDLPPAVAALRARLRRHPGDPAFASPEAFVRALAAALDTAFDTALEKPEAGRGSDCLEHGLRGERARGRAAERGGKLTHDPTAVPSGAADRSPRTMTDFVLDLRHALRRLRKAPAFACLVAFTLALGIGANAVMFSLIDGVVLQPLDFPDADRLMLLREEDPEGRAMWASYPNFADWRAGSRDFEAMAATTWPRSQTVTGADGPIRASFVSVTADYFHVAGLPPARGRFIEPDENRPGGPQVAVVSEEFWRHALGAPEDLDGVTIAVGDQIHEVVGVAPRGLSLIGQPDVWLPLERAVPWTVRGNHVIPVIGRLRAGADPVAVHRALDAIGARIAEQHAAETVAVGVDMRPFKEFVIGRASQPLRLLLMASGLLLLVACANVASAILARGLSRAHEIGIRSALGASRGRLFRLLITENAMLAGFGATAGLGMCWAAVHLLRQRAPAALPRLEEVSVDSQTLLFALAVGVLSVMVFGLQPTRALIGRSAANGPTAAVLRTSRSDRHPRVWRLLIATQVAAALVLLASAGLVVRSLWQILDTDVGYRARGVLVASVDLPTGESAAVADTYRRTVEALASLPGVETAGLASHLPLDAGNFVGPIVVDGRDDGPVAHYRIADAGYFETLGISLLQGRLFDRRDTASAAHVAVINRSTAERYWPGESPIGKRFEIGGMDPYRRPLTVVGVVGEARHWRLSAGTQLEYYVALSQRPALGRTLLLTLRAADGTAPAALEAAARATVRRNAPEASVSLEWLATRHAATTADRRLAAAVLMALAVVALLLAAAGVYGVFTYAVARRRQEMGIRLALGARPRQLIALVVGEAARTLAWGLAAGLVGTLGLARLLRSQLHATSPLDPGVLTVAVICLALTGLLASLVPALRARKVDPVHEIRSATD